MADTSDTTPLVDQSSSSSSPPVSTPVSPLKWYKYIVLFFLALALLGAFLSAFASPWKLLFVSFTIFVVLKVFHDHVIIPYKPRYTILPKSFWITQIGFAYFLAPLFLVLLAALLFLALGITAAVVFMLFHAIMTAVYPDAMAVLAEDLAKMGGPARALDATFFDHLKPFASPMSASASVSASATTAVRELTVVGATNTMLSTSTDAVVIKAVVVRDVVTALPTMLAGKVSLPSHVSRAVRGHVQHHYYHQTTSSSPPPAAVTFDFDSAAFSDDAEKIWQDMIDAGASPFVLVFVIGLFLLTLFLLFVIIGGIGVNALLELIKFKLFKRHKLRPDVTSLRVKGLGFFAVTGAFFLTLSSVLSTAYGIVSSFLNSLLFAVSALADTAVLVLTQLVVVAAFAESFVLQSAEYVALKRAWKTSVLFNFGLALLRVAPAARADVSGFAVDGKQMTENDAVPSPIGLVVLGGARIALLHKFGSAFAARFKAAFDADEESNTTQA